MSELTNAQNNRNGFRWRLLTTVSAIALLGAAYGTGKTLAADSDRPSLWIELNGQFSQQENDESVFIPPFLTVSPFDAATHAGLQKGPSTIWDEGAKISYRPAGSDWVLSASFRYGKNNRQGSWNQRTSQVSASGLRAFYNAYQNLDASSSESHAILDFQTGKDVGLGRLGGEGNSVLSAGVRIAQFNSRSSADIQSQPTNSVRNYHRFYASFAAKRRFTGIGPSLSWDASAELAGNPSTGSITFDWGANGAVLFGRQRAQTNHKTSEVYVPLSAYISSVRVLNPRIPVYQHSPSLPARSKNVVVPNLGGFAGVSWRYPNARVSVGYRADMFFGAIDGGVNTAQRENRGFYGPFATISIGLGG